MWPKLFAASYISNSDVHRPGVAVVHLSELVLAQCCRNVRWMINVLMFVHNRLPTAVGLQSASVCSRSVRAGSALSNCQSDNIVGEELLRGRKFFRLFFSVKWLKDATFVCLFVGRFVTPLFTDQHDGMPNFKTVNVKQVSKSFELESLSRTVTDRQCL
jgi:hypothetical protein